MFYVSITDEKGRPVKPSLEKTDTPANYFAGCLYLLIDLLNGGNELKEVFNQFGLDTKKHSTKIANMSAIVMFLDQLHNHPAFEPDKVFDENYINYPVIQKIASLLKEVPMGDTSAYIYFLKLLSEFKVEGIKSVEFSNDFTKNQEALYQCNFPDEFIPEEYLCLLSSQLMDVPCYDKRDPEKIFDKTKLKKEVDKSGKNPYTKLALSMEEGIAVNLVLQNKIGNFMDKVILVPNSFPETYDDEYIKRKQEICGQLSFKDFKSQLEDEILKQKKSTQDDVSIKAHLDISQNSNPLKLYQSAIQNYKEKKFDEAINQLIRALGIFEAKTVKDSKECFNCYSTLISCFRELKNYKDAINFSESAIVIFYGRLDMTPIIKKYRECLKLRGDKLEDIYDRAIVNYNAGKYNLAIQQWLFLTEVYEKDKKAELACCHSTLASCYREVKAYQIAKEHCEQALSLRRDCLKKGDKLIQRTEKKLEDICSLIKNQKQISP